MHGGSNMKLKYLYSQVTGMYIVLGILTIGFLSVAIVSYYSIASTLERNIRRTIIFRTAESADLVKRESETAIDKIEGIAQCSSIMSMDWERQEPVLRSEYEKLDLLNIQVANMRGIARSLIGANNDVADTEYFKKAKNGISELTVLMQPGEVKHGIVLCSVPIFNDSGYIVGVLVASMKSQSLFDIVDSRRIGTSGFCFIVNRQGDIIAHPEYQNIELTPVQKGRDRKDRQFQILTEKMARGEVGNGFYLHDGIEEFLAFAPIYGTEWSLAITVPKDEIFSEIDALRERYAVFISVPILITALSAINVNRYKRQRKKLVAMKEVARKNAKLLKESMEMDQLKTDFFANISHELRTPLSVILASLQMLELNMKKDPALNTDYFRRYLHTIKQNCLRSIRLSNNLIDTTKIDAGYFEIHKTNCNIVRLVEDITLSVADYIKGKGIEVQFNTEIEEKTIACDIDRMERVVLNLLSNAVKFTNTGGQIHVGIADRECSVVISIKDTGIGIPEDKTEQIFERFRQVDKSTTRNNEGSGIGLALVKSLVSMHNGTVTVKSTLGEGSEFIIILPAVVLPEENSPARKVLLPDQTHYFEKINVEFSDIYK